MRLKHCQETSCFRASPRSSLGYQDVQHVCALSIPSFPHPWVPQVPFTFECPQHTLAHRVGQAQDSLGPHSLPPPPCPQTQWP